MLNRKSRKQKLTLKIAHASITVKNMDQSIDFYTKILGLKLKDREEIPENEAEIAFVAGDGEAQELELTFWRNKKDWTDGDQLDHIAFIVSDVGKTVEDLRKKGVEIAKEPYSLQGSKSKIAFIKDPNGIWLELIEH
jgi:lactoylglutathione lyase